MESQQKSSTNPLSLHVSAIAPAGADTILLRLADRDGAMLPPAAPGAHVTLLLPGGIDRQYSLIEAGDALREYVIAVRREPNSRGGSAAVHDGLRPGSAIGVLPPRNDFPLVTDARHSVLIGGGIGITPLLSMASWLGTHGRAFDLHAAFASRPALLLADRLDRVPQARLHFDDAAGGPFPLAATIAAAPRDAHLYCCGPAAMIQDFIAMARADGRDDAAIHFEYFAPPPAAAPAGSFTVALARSGIELAVPPGKSILEVVRAAGIAAGSSCEQGTCGACEVRVIEGIPDHFDAVLSPKDKREGKSMMICCSGALSDRLVLDL
ncbi:PDR/VanB family oxidoreductase [Sphingomonas canadensis]|uniref:PDR/VanB family oxidoreductase n=1 Tax=Sphingomonas canadensis TaxID=1219257 RepID=A0ABW3H7A5_9SPHN|nr:PDR/VanB family oxidoreductase [Sphingomonas canadensis]MCW3836970.1 PDR/VanB family oxidoreductase [Sphingomonas canadensis]